MHKTRVKKEITILTNVCRAVDWDLSEGRVDLLGFQFPRGWTPDTGTIRYDLPRNYPATQPKAYLEAKMRYQGERPYIMHDPENGWSVHCIHDLRDQWIPQRHTLITITRMIKKSLEKPNDPAPLTYK